MKKTTDEQGKGKKKKKRDLLLKLNTEFKIIYEKKCVFAGVCGSLICSNTFISGQIIDLVYGLAVFCLCLVKSCCMGWTASMLFFCLCSDKWKKKKLENQGKTGLLLSSGNTMKTVYLIAFTTYLVNMIINFY